MFENRDSTEKYLYKCYALLLLKTKNQSHSSRIEIKREILMEQAVELKTEIIQGLKGQRSRQVHIQKVFLAPQNKETNYKVLQ